VSVNLRWQRGLSIFIGCDWAKALKLNHHMLENIKKSGLKDLLILLWSTYSMWSIGLFDQKVQPLSSIKLERREHLLDNPKFKIFQVSEHERLNTYYTWLINILDVMIYNSLNIKPKKHEHLLYLKDLVGVTNKY